MKPNAPPVRDWPLVTLVTPAYNQAEYLAETIESVLAQDYPALEYIVLDDGSSDDTPAVLSRYEGRIVHLRHDNQGQARTLNRGWAMARGQLLGYLSSDDRLRPDAIRLLASALLDRPSAVVAYGDFQLIDASGAALRTVRTEAFDEQRLRVDLVCQPGAGALFRREVFERLGGWNEALRQVPDFEFWLRASRLGGFVRVPQVLAEYRIHEGSASFRPMSRERAEEIVRATSAFWGDAPQRDARRSLATAHLLASKNHAQSGRLGGMLSHAWAAWRRHPGIALTGRYWRALLAGLGRRMYYRARGVVGRG